MRVIGGFALSAGGRSVDLRNRKAQAILAQLALSAPPRLPRERLADALWSESGADQARQSLRQTLHDLRRSLTGGEAALLEAGRSEVALRAGALRVDVLDLIAAVETGSQPPEDVDWTALADAILPGLDDVDPVFAEWLTARRAALLTRIVAALEARMDAAAGEAARPWAAALAALDPAHEPACRRLMEADAARGDMRAALRRYAVLWDLLDADYAAEPSPETQALAVRLKSLEPPPAPVTRPSLTLAVGVFRADGVHERFGYLVRGFRQDLIASLTPNREWVVVEPAPGEGPPPVDGVYELEGVAYPSHSGVRINVTLKQTAARRYVWGQQNIELDLASWFETCALTTRRIAAALDVRIAGDRLSQQARLADRELPLYDKLLMARDLLNRWTPEDDERAEAIFLDILAADPGFTRARIGLARLRNSAHIVHPGFPRPAPGALDTVALARAAAEADPLDSGAMLCLGWSLAMEGRPEEAVAALVAACETNPTDPRTLASAGDALANCGALERAREAARASLELDLGASRLNWGYRASVALYSDDLEGAVEAVRRCDGALPIAGGYGVAALERMGRRAAARAAWARYAAYLRDRWRAPGEPDDAALLAWFLAAPPIADPDRRADLGATMRAVLAG